MSARRNQSQFGFITVLSAGGLPGGVARLRCCPFCLPGGTPGAGASPGPSERAPGDAAASHGSSLHRVALSLNSSDFTQKLILK